MGVSPRSPTSGSRPSSVVWMQWRCLLSPSRQKSWGNAWRHCPTTMMTNSGSPPWRSWVSEARHEVSFLGLDKALKHDHNILQTEIIGWILMFFFNVIPAGFDTEGLSSAVWPGGETEALTRLERHLERKVSQVRYCHYCLFYDKTSPKTRFFSLFVVWKPWKAFGFCNV